MSLGSQVRSSAVSPLALLSAPFNKPHASLGEERGLLTRSCFSKFGMTFWGSFRVILSIPNAFLFQTRPDFSAEVHSQYTSWQKGSARSRRCSCPGFESHQTHFLRLARSTCSFCFFKKVSTLSYSNVGMVVAMG